MDIILAILVFFGYQPLQGPYTMNDVQVTIHQNQPVFNYYVQNPSQLEQLRSSTDRRDE